MTVSNDFTTDYRVYREAQALLEEGHQVTIFCVHLPDLARSEDVDGIKVRRILDNHLRLPVTKGARQVRQRWLHELRQANADLYHAHDRDTLDYTAKVAREKGVPFIYDSHEYWPDKNQYENNTGSLRDRLSGIWWTAKEGRHARQANAIIMTSPGHATGLVKKHRVQQPVLVRNTPLYQRGTDRSLLRRKFQLTGQDKIIIYGGNVQRNRGIEEVISSLKYLPENYHFVTLGYGKYAAELEKNIPAELAQRVHFHEPVHFLKYIPLMYAADMGIAPFQASCYSHYHVLPNKPFDYLMAELPIATSNFPDMKKIVLENKVGTVFEPDQPKDIARAIRHVLENEQRYQVYRANATKASETEFRWDREKVNLVDLYRKLFA